MSTSAVSSAETAVSFYCHACTARFSLPAPSSPFHFTLCPRCRGCYLDDDDCPAPLPPEPAQPARLLPPPPPPWLSSPSCTSAMTQPPPPPPCVPWPRRSISSATMMLPLPPIPWVVRSSSSSWSCTRPSSSSTRPPPTLSGIPNSSIAPVPYYCPKHSSAVGKEAQRCRSCRIHGSREEQPNSCSSSSTVSSPSSAYSSACSSPLLGPPTPPPQAPLHHGELQHESSSRLTLRSSTTAETMSTFQDLCPPPPPPWLRLASAPLGAWDDIFLSPSDEERPRPPAHRSEQQSTPTRTPPVSTYDSMLNAPLLRGGPQAAPPASIAALPTVTVPDTALVCPICTEPLLPSAAARRLPCGHLYHSDCIVTWLSLRNSCPVCRRIIPMFPSTTAETAPSPSLSPSPPESLPQQTPGRRRSLPGIRRIRRICRRLLRSTEISGAHQPSRSGNAHL